ncbi:MAG: GTP-binding protein, partial [Erysipelotrichia bacterium]|nr:GTP-binding protein [Erysipelotrichia bacterium]
HDEDEECCCHHHDHDEDEEHHHHHADEIFTSWGIETNRQYDYKEIENILKELDNQEKYGTVLRAKGIVASKDGKWLYFDYVPEETDIREGKAIAMGRLCVIGSKINEQEIIKLFK